MPYRELWRKTANLFWANPILWLPLIATALLNDLIFRGVMLFEWQLKLWLLYTQTGIGGVQHYDSSNLARILLLDILNGLSSFASRYLLLLIQLAALIATAAIANSFLNSQPASFGQLPSLFRGRKRAILWLTLKAFLLYLGLLIPPGILMALALIKHFPAIQQAPYPQIELPIAFLAMGFTAFLLAPSFARLLPFASGLTFNRNRRLTLQFLVTAGFLLNGLVEEATTWAWKPFSQGSLSEHLAPAILFDALGNALNVVPLILLAIAIAILLQTPDSSPPEEPESYRELDELPLSSSELERSPENT